MVAYRQWLQKWKQTKDNVQAEREEKEKKKSEEKIFRKKKEDKNGFGKLCK